MARLPSITIDGVKYPCNEWKRAQAGRVIRHDWEEGFIDGMGSLTRRSARDYYASNGMDATSYPYLRLHPQATTIALGVPTPFGANPFQGAFGFIEQSPNGTQFFYLLNGQYVWKINVATNTLETTGTEQPRSFASNVTIGRPAFFDGDWYVGLSFNVDAQKLTAIAETGEGNDIWVGVGVRALHFARLQDRDTAKLARAHQPNLIDISSDGISWPADDFEVGDASLFISDLLTTAGNAELIITRADGIFLFDSEGNSHRVQEFVGQGASGKANKAAFDGTGSYVHGPLMFWPHSSGFWRLQGDSALPVGPESDPEWNNLSLDGFQPLKGGQWQSAQAWGEWVYATYGASLFVGRITGDGRIQWHGVMFRSAAGVLRCILTEGTSGDGPDLWVTDTNVPGVHRFALDADGSPRTSFGSKRGAASSAFQHWLPRVSAGQGHLRELVQWRFEWVRTEGFPANGSASLQLAAHMDNASSSTNIGSAITTNDTFTRSWAAGTSDTAYEIQPTFKITTNSSYAPANADPRIRAFGVEGVTAAIYSAEILLLPDELSGYSVGVQDALKKLRNLRNAPAVAIREPGFDSTFSGYIKDMDEVAVPGKKGPDSVGYVVNLLIQRWDWNTAS